MAENYSENIDNNGESNSEDYDIDDYDSDDYEENVYDCDEISPTKYNIVLCELFNHKLHGSTNSDVSKHYLLINRIKKLDFDFIDSWVAPLNQDYIDRQEQITPHKFIRNYKNMIIQPNYIKPEIGKIINLPTGHSVCIIKTMWLRVIQRAWKRLIKERKQIIQMRCRLQSLKHREITGWWPENCRYWPSLQGLLINRRRITG
jgi:hypothetical protein